MVAPGNEIPFEWGQRGHWFASLPVWGGVDDGQNPVSLRGVWEAAPYGCFNAGDNSDGSVFAGLKSRAFF
jgi:hypothetical protein